ncbi:sigma-54 interaction domain-containing protein [Halopseudomonas xiamenensis]|uniref:sigma-54 interaction domain-containing protein n=1 Tax=Halopseudomonas xiamenensis TaxID=157792 RepID=UPI0016283D32|nr:sigma 54-interacting transcriptional regulator [Halopseudomonas xiamenensis]
MTEAGVVLVCWLGGNDLNALSDGPSGPVLSTLQAFPFRRLELLSSYPAAQAEAYRDWLIQQTGVPVALHCEDLSSPVHFGEIHNAASRHLERLQQQGEKLAILLSPGTAAMQAVWILLGKTRYPAIFYQSSREQGAQQIDIPFEIAAEYVPAANIISSDEIARLATRSVPVDAAFDSILTQNSTMQRLKEQAQILAQKTVPVLIYGETGTGKELFARAIHNAGPRADAPFVPINCGAIPAELIDSILFGHRKGAFTGAVSDRPGVFQQANGGTLFLDEFGELSPDVQVRLLRVLQEGTCMPVGSSVEQRVDVRIIAATHRDLMLDVAEGRFREDLFYRVAVGGLHLPPLRERAGDLLLLADALLATIGQEDPSLQSKVLSVGAKNLIIHQPWRGNVREMQATLLRAALWCHGDTIEAMELQRALFSVPNKDTDILARDVSQGIDIQVLVGGLVRHYIAQALDITGRNKTRAAALLGLKSQQTLSNWMDKYDME